MGGVRIRWSGLAVVAFVLLLALLMLSTHAKGPDARISMISDWSHHHVAFSRPNSITVATKLQTEPRYWMHVMRRNAGRHGQARLEDEDEDQRATEFGHRTKKRGKEFQRDWAQSLGANGTTGAPLSGVNWWRDPST